MFRAVFVERRKRRLASGERSVDKANGRFDESSTDERHEIDEAALRDALSAWLALARMPPAIVQRRDVHAERAKASSAVVDDQPVVAENVVQFARRLYGERTSLGVDELGAALKRVRRACVTHRRVMRGHDVLQRLAKASRLAGCASLSAWFALALERHGGARARIAAQRAADDATAPSPRLGLNELRNAMRELGSALITAEALEAAGERRSSFVFNDENAHVLVACAREVANGTAQGMSDGLSANELERAAEAAAAAHADRELVMVSAVSQGLEAHLDPIIQCMGEGTSQRNRARLTLNMLL